MKKIILILALIVSTFTLVGCSSDKPMNEVEQATSYSMTLEEYREAKQAAARMNMTFDEHQKMLMEEGEDGMNDDMGM